MQSVSPCNFYFLSIYIMTYNTRFVFQTKSSITAPGPLTLKLISKQARLTATKSVLVDLAMWLVGSDARNAWQIFAAKLGTHITSSGTVLCILITAIRRSFFRERTTSFPNKREEGPPDNTSCFTQSDDHFCYQPFYKGGHGWPNPRYRIPAFVSGTWILHSNG